MSNMTEAPATSPVKEKKRGFTQEFIFFLKTFGIIGLAIAFIIGQAASTLVTAFVTDIIDPIIGFFLPGGNLSAYLFRYLTFTEMQFRTSGMEI
jgi:large-conductance mechanosensitive channel